MLPNYIGPMVVLLVLFQEGKIRWQNPELFPQAELTHTVLQQDGWGTLQHIFHLPSSIFYKLHSEPVSYALTGPKEELQDLAKVTSGKITKVRDYCPRQSIQKIAQIIIIIIIVP